MTDDELEVLAERPDLVIATPPEALAAMDDVVRQMHTRSGLLDAISASTISLAQAADETLEFVRKHVPEARKVPLCGNSIGTDRRFLAAYMPELEEYLHYRSIDVSTIKELAKRWYPDAVAAAPRKVGAHRALDDIKESVEELRYWRIRHFSRKILPNPTLAVAPWLVNRSTKNVRRYGGGDDPCDGRSVPRGRARPPAEGQSGDAPCCS